MPVSSELIREFVFEAGFSLCGIARVRNLEEYEARLSEWLDKGYYAGLDYLKRNVEKRLNPACLVEGAKTVVVCAVNYKNEMWDQGGADGPKVASYAYGKDYHIELKKMFAQVLSRINEVYPNVSGRCFTDSAPVLEKAWAVEAGLGWIGKNSLLITPAFGSFIFLGELIIDAEVDNYDIPYGKDGCGICTACLGECPVSALVAPKVLDARRCISRLTIEKMPEGEEYDPVACNEWIFGCDECQSCCPYNKKTPMHTLRVFDIPTELLSNVPDFWHKLSEDDFKRIFGAGPMSRVGYDKIMRRVDQIIKPRNDDLNE